MLPKIFPVAVFLCCVATALFPQTPTDIPIPAYFNGITLENLDQLNGEQWRQLDAIPTVTVVRVVFQKDTAPDKYRTNLDILSKKIFPISPSTPLSGKKKFFIMGLILDSEAMARYRWNCVSGEGCTHDESPAAKSHDYKTRIESYLALDSFVDIWEVGNEVNGEWADEACIPEGEKGCKWVYDRNGKRISPTPPRPDITAEKIKFAISRIPSGKPIALTLIHMPECITWDDNTMIEWTNSNLKPKIDGETINYLLISYYEDNCDNGKKTIAPESAVPPEERKRLTPAQLDRRLRSIYWNAEFSELNDRTFSNIQYIGFGEVGYSKASWICKPENFERCKRNEDLIDKKIKLMNRYYAMEITHPKFLGGHFWWNAQEDIIYPLFLTSMISNFKRLP